MVALPTASEREIYREYDKGGRLRVTRRFSQWYIGLLVLSVCSTLFTFKPTFDLAHIAATLAPSLLPVAGYALAWWLTNRRQDIAAAGVFTAVTILLVAGFQFYYATTIGVGPLVVAIVASYLNMIIIAGLIGNTWLMAAVTALECVLTVFMLLVVPQLLGQHLMPQVTITLVALLFILVAGAVQFGVANWQHQQVLRELGDVRVAYERARQIEDIKNQFIQSVSHELRTPMMAVVGNVANLRFPVEALLNHQQLPERVRVALVDMLEDIRHAREAGTDLTNLTNSILDASSIAAVEGREVDLQPVNLRTALDAAQRLIDYRGTERELHLNIAPDIWVMSHAVRLQQILTNLLSNALKYSAEGSPIDVTAQVLRGRTPMAEIRVRDYGLGIPPEQIPVLFQKFIRLPRDMASTIIGNGLGLYLCRVYTESMGGKIWVESSGIEGEGSTFIMRLPLATSPAASATPMMSERATHVV